MFTNDELMRDQFPDFWPIFDDLRPQCDATSTSQPSAKVMLVWLANNEITSVRNAEVRLLMMMAMIRMMPMFAA